MLATNGDKLVAAALRRLELLKKDHAFDPIDLDSKPTQAQQEVIDDFGIVRTQWIVAANQSGKSQTACRLVSWVLTETHPSWTRPDAWGDEALLIIVAGRTGKQLEESLLPKIESYLKPGTYKVVRIGNIVQRLEHENGNRIVFQSLENPNVAAERTQSYVAHMVLVDEMPPTEKIVSELMVRRNSRSGYFLASFTPLVVNDTIRKMVDSATLPYAKKYVFRMFDNPLYHSEEKRQEILASMSNIPEHVRNTRLYGDWSISDDSVYYFEYDKMVAFPYGYSRMWRHVESVDPALSSALGYTLWAEDPDTLRWYCVKAKYFKGIFVPTDLVAAVRKESEGHNIVRRISDPHEVWYIQTASSMGISYMGVHKKNDRKGELIKGLQEKLGVQCWLTPEVMDTLGSEIQECQWSDKTAGKIINSSSYHLLDSSQYFCDNIPKSENKVVLTDWHAELLKANAKRLAMEEKAPRSKKDNRRPVRMSRRGWR